MAPGHNTNVMLYTDLKAVEEHPPELLHYLLIKSAVESTPANLHESLGGDEHFINPFP